MAMKHLHLVKAVASLVAAAAWAIPLARPTLAAPDDLSTADRDLLVQVRLLSLLAHPAGVTARDRGGDEQVRQIGEKLATEHGDLDRLVRVVAAQVGVELPAAAPAEEQDSLHELAAARDEEFDRVFVGRLRAANERVFPMIAAVRASTRNDAVRAFATTADAYVARHLDYLDGTGMVSHTAPPTVKAGGGSGCRPSLDALDGVELTTEGGLGAADREFLVCLSQAVLWKQLAGILAQQRAASAHVKETGNLITDEARELNREVLSAAKRLNVPLPARPNAEQQKALTKLDAATGADFDRTFVKQLRVADGELLFASAEIRAGTRNDVIRTFSATANSVVLRHMAYLEGSGLVRYEELPTPPRAAGLTTTGLERDDGIRPAAIWLMLAVTVVVGALTRGRPVDTTHRATTRSPSREVMRHELPSTPEAPMVLEWRRSD
ncbi:DUF4142 domain-containing protein [Dactylosporangium sp. NPDC048998]|uniref:DUF4142 domain-containing protein n=1 Tax=Dactylosporangium sp. NPDC048998 TaxID=3363976 RepID=UPI00372436F9